MNDSQPKQDRDDSDHDRVTDEGDGNTIHHAIDADRETPDGFDDASEICGAIIEAQRAASAESQFILNTLAEYHAGLPEWRKAQLRKVGYHGKTDGPRKLQILIDTMLNLAAVKSDDAFRLSYREAADAIRTSRSRVWAWMHTMESAGVLICVSRGNWRKKLSTTYKFADGATGRGNGDGLPF